MIYNKKNITKKFTLLQRNKNLKKINEVKIKVSKINVKTRNEKSIDKDILRKVKKKNIFQNLIKRYL